MQRIPLNERCQCFVAMSKVIVGFTRKCLKLVIFLSGEKQVLKKSGEKMIAQES